MTLFVGNEQASNNTNSPAEVSGFCAPPSGAVNGTLFVSAIEGDANKSGPHMLFGDTPTLTIADNSLSGVNNNINNFFGSQINTLFPVADTSALLDTRGTFGNNNSNAFSGNVPAGSRQGYDITAVDVSDQLVNNQTTAYALGVTTSDDYTINALGLQIPVGSPALAGTKTVDTVDIVAKDIGDLVTFECTFTNNGTADASDVVFKDLLESGLTYVVGTFQVNGILVVPQPPNVSSGYSIGTVPVGETVTIQFQALITGYPPDGNVHLNDGTVDYSFSTCVMGESIDLTASTNEVEIQLPFNQIPNIVATKAVNGATEIDSQLGAVLTFHFVLTNEGTGDALNVVLSDLLESGLTYVPLSASVNGRRPLPDPDPEVGIPVGTILVGALATVDFQATIDAPPVSGTQFHNQAHIDYQYQDNNGIYFDLDTDTNIVTINLDPPPGDFTGVVKSCKFFDRSSYCLTATWVPVIGLRVVAYNIYHNGRLVSTIPYSAPLIYRSCFNKRKDIGLYQIAAAFEGGGESERTNLVIVNE